jgi:plasmid maintenance system antidote protein VapI
MSAGIPLAGKRQAMTTLYPYDPDYVVPTADVLREWLDHNHVSTSVAAVVASIGRGTDSHVAATKVLDAVLNDHKVTPKTAAVLTRVTGISMAFWLAFDHNYRTGKAAGKVVG